MVAYIFKAENSVTKKTYIGKNLSVKFDKHYVGDNPGVLSDVQKYGADKFTVNMILACETVKDCDLAYDAILKEYNAKSDEKFYNYEPSKRKKKEKETDEPLSELVE